MLSLHDALPIFGHVHFHRHLWAEKFQHGQRFDRRSHENKAVCKRDTIIQAANYDWMEWQAGYVSGAILMPVTSIRRLVSEYCQERDLHAAVAVRSDHGRSEEHTSELQSLMRISYAVFCFKKKNNKLRKS